MKREFWEHKSEIKLKRDQHRGESTMGMLWLRYIPGKHSEVYHLQTNHITKLSKKRKFWDSSEVVCIYHARRTISNADEFFFFLRKVQSMIGIHKMYEQK